MCVCVYIYSKMTVAEECLEEIGSGIINVPLLFLSLTLDVDTRVSCRLVLTHTTKPLGTFLVFLHSPDAPGHAHLQKPLLIGCDTQRGFCRVPPFITAFPKARKGLLWLIKRL